MGVAHEWITKAFKMVAKGQLILKGTSSILPKNELENVNFCPQLLGQIFFVCLMGELKKKLALSKLTDLYAAAMQAKQPAWLTNTVM